MNKQIADKQKSGGISRSQENCSIVNWIRSITFPYLLSASKKYLALAVLFSLNPKPFLLLKNQYKISVYSIALPKKYLLNGGKWK